MKKKTFERPKRINVLKMSIEEINKSNQSIQNEIKRITPNKNQILPRNVTPEQRYSNANKSKHINTHTNTSISPLPKNTPFDTSSNTNSFIIKGPTIITAQQNINNFTDCIINQLERSISTDHNQKRELSFDYKIIPKNKLLLPMSSMDQLKIMRLCEKSLLPSEKNYFVSEKNFKLIIDTLRKKEQYIENLKILLDLAKSDLKNCNQSLASNTKDIDNMNQQKIQQLLIDNSQLDSQYNDLMFQYNKILSMHNRILALLSFISDYSNNKVNSNSNTDIVKMINSKIEELELDSLIKLLDQEQFAQCINSNTNTHECDLIDKNVLLCKEFKKKINDTQELLKVYEKIDNDKIDNLSEIAKDMLKTKRRLKELNDLNDKLEKENTYLRISFQNLYCENEGKNKKNQNQILFLSKRVDEQNRILTNLQNENIQLASESNEARELLIKHLKDQSVKDNNINGLENKVSLLNETIKEQDTIIMELKRSISELEAKKSIADSLLKGSNSQLVNKRKGDPTVAMYEDIMKTLNKSSDCLLDNNNAYNNYISDNSNSNKKQKQKEKQYYEIDSSKEKNKIELKKDLEIKILKDKISSLEKEEKNLYFEGDNEEIGVNGVMYISDLLMHLYNQAKVIEDIII